MADSDDSSIRELCYLMGLGLATWQHVEHEHFAIFKAVSGINDSQTCSLVYYAIESFDGRRIMAGRVIRSALKTKDENREWNGIEKALKEGNENRNKLAHYWLAPEVRGHRLVDDHLEIEFGPLRLQPSPFNAVSKLLGRTVDKEGHKLDTLELKRYVSDFVDLSEQLTAFAAKFVRTRQPPQVSYAQALAPFLNPQFLSPPSQEKSPREGDPPSGE